MATPYDSYAQLRLNKEARPWWLTGEGLRAAAGGFGEGLTDGAENIGNAATFGLVPALKSRSDANTGAANQASKVLANIGLLAVPGGVVAKGLGWGAKGVSIGTHALRGAKGLATTGRYIAAPGLVSTATALPRLGMALTRAAARAPGIRRGVSALKSTRVGASAARRFGRLERAIDYVSGIRPGVGSKLTAVADTAAGSALLPGGFMVTDPASNFVWMEGQARPTLIPHYKGYNTAGALINDALARKTLEDYNRNLYTSRDVGDELMRNIGK